MHKRQRAVSLGPRDFGKFPMQLSAGNKDFPFQVVISSDEPTMSQGSGFRRWILQGSDQNVWVEALHTVLVHL